VGDMSEYFLCETKNPTSDILLTGATARSRSYRLGGKKGRQQNKRPSTYVERPKNLLNLLD